MNFFWLGCIPLAKLCLGLSHGAGKYTEGKLNAVRTGFVQIHHDPAKGMPKSVASQMLFLAFVRELTPSSISSQHPYHGIVPQPPPLLV